MAIYKLIQNTAFEPKDIERLVTAYEQTLRTLRLKDRSDPITQLVAEKIIAIGRLGIRIDSVNVNEAVREVIELTYGEALKNRVSVRTQLAEGLPLMQGDRVQLQQVILNLILNAVQSMGAVTNGARGRLITTSQTEPKER